ncbi:alpha-ketoacid dehydrogenase subunit beta [Stigmatella aurantiaca]|uniref:Transketolase central region n=2 Tax=Stigmatella aurantiaca (strain DW4/3-1) TaxID=378806 RepID=E3FE45_STIAD|nr:alpha-ketoacid dehydrogenase subunit beta [Stigmatella aurantiaca]ADO72648.1 Transketolase central region [Stigmatella aurantiaca DW4/3-1]
MPLLSLVQAVNDALRLEMRRDPDLVVLGEDVGRLGGVFRATSGLQEEFGPERVVDTPLSEGGILGAAIGMALYGLKPVPEIQFADFLFPAMDQLVNELAKLRYRSGGQYTAPMVVRAPYGGGVKGGLYHSQSPEALFIHTAGLKVVVPSSPYDAKGLLLAALRQPDPILFFEPKRLYRSHRQEVPEEDYTLELGRAQVVRSGQALTVIAWGAMLHEAMTAAEQAQALGIGCELIDLRTLWPLDIACIEESVRKTGRALIVHEAPRTCGLGAELAALIQERCFLSLEAPVKRVTGWDTPFPYALEKDYLPLAPRILHGIQETVAFQA